MLAEGIPDSGVCARRREVVAALGRASGGFVVDYGCEGGVCFCEEGSGSVEVFGYEDAGAV